MQKLKSSFREWCVAYTQPRMPSLKSYTALSESLLSWEQLLILMRHRLRRGSVRWHTTTPIRQRDAKPDCIRVLMPWRRHTFGTNQKCRMRSAFYWFAEFCHSQCLSHFAASFIVTRAEGSIAESCKEITNFSNEIKEVVWLTNDAYPRPKSR